MNERVLRAIEANERYDVAQRARDAADVAHRVALVEFHNAWDGLTKPERKSLQAVYDSRLADQENPL